MIVFLSFRRNLYVAFLSRFCRAFVAFCHSEGISKSRVIVFFVVFCHSEGISMSRFCRVFCRVFVAFCHSEGIFKLRVVVLLSRFVIQKESLYCAFELTRDLEIPSE